MTSIVILPIDVCEVEIDYGWRVIVVVTTEVLSGRVCERREVKGIVMMVRLLKLVHNGLVGLWRVELGQEPRIEVAIDAMTSSFY